MLKIKYRKGAIYIYALIIITVMAVFFTTYILSSNTVVTNAQHYMDLQKAYYVSIAGIEDTLSVLKNDINRDSAVSGSVDGINYTTTIMQTYKNVVGSDTERRVTIVSECSYQKSKKQIEVDVTLTSDGVTTNLVVDKWKIVH